MRGAEMTYIDKIIANLEDYKKGTLKIPENGMYKKNKKEYAHILTIEDKDKNIINKGFYEEILRELSKVKKHTDFHHLNSSQALTFNLFSPMIIKDNLKELLSFIDYVDNIKLYEYEHIEKEEEEKKTKEGTNFDFFIEGEERKYFFEVKYTERGFGSIDGTKQSHQDKYINIYLDKLNKIGNFSKEEFFSNYQLLRNLIYTQEGIVSFVIPKKREDLYNKIDLMRQKINNPNNCKILYIEDLCNFFKNITNFRNHYEEFEEKYLP